MESTPKKNAVEDSPNFRNGAFQNLSITPAIAEGVSYLDVILKSLKRVKNVRPERCVPHVKTDLRGFYSETPAVIWFGHSSYLVHCKGINILVDPVFSGHASPFSFMVKAFDGSNIYNVDQMPDIDYLVITHNHYDHLDRKTIARLKNRIKYCYAPLGVSDYLQQLGVPVTAITVLDWGEQANVNDDIHLTAAPARHFSGRGLARNKSLWTSYVLEIFGYRIYLGGDSGYDTHFKQIGNQFGGFDLAILECGQYSKDWPYIHMMPEETVQAAVDLNARWLLPVHWAKFVLSTHAWNEPVKRALVEASILDVKITTPLIGEPVVLTKSYPVSRWWEFD